MILQDTAWINCPYCGERIEILLDGSIEYQQYYEDCEVCCRPILITVTINTTGSTTGEISLSVRNENDT